MTRINIATGTDLVAFRERHELTVDELAAIVGRDRRAVNYWERGFNSRGIPTAPPHWISMVLSAWVADNVPKKHKKRVHANA